MFKRNLLSFLFIALSAVSQPASAGNPIGSTEATQVANNGELMLQVGFQIDTVAELVRQFELQYQQYATQIANLQKLNPAKYNKSLEEILSAMNAMKAYKARVEALEGSVDAAARAYETRFTEAKLLNLSWGDYVQRVVQQTDQDNKHAIERIRQEKLLLEQVQRDYEYAREAHEKVESSAGAHQSLQQLNYTMNRIVQQNATVIQLLSQAHGDKGRGESLRTVRERSSQSQAERARNADILLRQRMREFGEGK